MRTNLVHLVAFLTVAASLGTGSPSRADAPSPVHRPVTDSDAFARETDAWMSDALARLEVLPGLAVAVVVDDRVVLARGWGVADREANLPATEETVYYIASATKSFTALAAAILDARGAIDLESSFASHVHGIAIDPALVPEQVRLRDFLTHTSGIENDPIASRLAYTGEHDPELLGRLLAKCAPAEDAPLGAFRYSNAGYNIVTILTDREIGKPWQDLLRDEIFEPLGMKRTTAYVSRVREQAWPMAAPYSGAPVDGNHRIALEKHDDTMQSAGGMMTTARDLGRWLAFQLGDGRLDGEQIVDAAIVRGTRDPLVEASGRPPFGGDHYGLGWWIGSYRGHELVHHSGGFAGFRSLVSFSPDGRVGVAVLGNEATVGARFVDVAAVWMYDWWLGSSEEERAAPGLLDELLAQRVELDARFAAQAEAFAKRKWMLSRPREAYAGTYASDLWGTVEITAENGELVVRAGRLQCVATAFEKPETMRVELVPGTGQVAAFAPEDGAVETLSIGGDVYARVK
jgi:CubicO group peptidase (beta-lactamase class C family)